MLVAEVCQAIAHGADTEDLVLTRDGEWYGFYVIDVIATAFEKKLAEAPRDFALL